jgi:hypothetical protein
MDVQSVGTMIWLSLDRIETHSTHRCSTPPRLAHYTCASTCHLYQKRLDVEFYYNAHLPYFARGNFSSAPLGLLSGSTLLYTIGLDLLKFTRPSFGLL